MELQAETFTASSGVDNSTRYGGFTGTGYADFQERGCWREWKLECSPGKSVVSFIAANGTASDRLCDVSLNGVKVATLKVTPTGAWPMWKPFDLVLDLKQTNILRLTQATDGGPNLDRIIVADPVLAPVVIPARPESFTLKPTKTVNGFTAASNSVYENLLIKGTVNCRGVRNVILRNCIVDGGRTLSKSGVYWGIRTDNAMGVTIEHCEVRNVAAAAIYGDGFKAIGNYIHHTGGDGFKPGEYCLIQGNYIAKLGWASSSAHSDGVQITGGHDVRVVGNYFDMPLGQSGYKSNAAILIQGGNGGAYNIDFEGNWCRGGNFTVRAFSDGGDASSIGVTRNIFYRGTPRYGFGVIETGVVWSGNIDDAGKPVKPSDK